MVYSHMWWNHNRYYRLHGIIKIYLAQKYICAAHAANSYCIWIKVYPATVSVNNSVMQSGKLKNLSKHWR